MPNKTRKFFIAKGLLTIFEELNIEPWIFSVDKDLDDRNYTLDVSFVTKTEKLAKSLWMDICVKLLEFCRENDLSIESNDIKYKDSKRGGTTNWAKIIVRDELPIGDTFGMNE